MRAPQRITNHGDRAVHIEGGPVIAPGETVVIPDAPYPDGLQQLTELLHPDARDPMAPVYVHHLESGSAAGDEEA